MTIWLEVGQLNGLKEMRKLALHRPMFFELVSRDIENWDNFSSEERRQAFDRNARRFRALCPDSPLEFSEEAQARPRKRRFSGKWRAREDSNSVNRLLDAKRYAQTGLKAVEMPVDAARLMPT